jgi:ABC-type transporter MlaC component
MRTVWVGLVLASLLGLAGCKSTSEDPKAAVQAAIEKRLKDQPNLMLQNMTLEVGEVKINGDTAEADAKFTSKQAPNLTVGVHYSLRKSNGQWEVVSSSSSGAGMNPHGGAMPNPHEGMGGSAPEQPAAGEAAPQASH